MTLSILHVAAEASPFIRTGGLADVCSALPRAIARTGARVTLVMPRHRAIDPARHALARRLTPVEVELGGRREEVIVYEGKLPGGHVPVFLVDHPLFDRDGIYGQGGAEFPDNALRFGLLGKAALAIADHLDHWPDVVHAHDWPGSLALAYARRPFHARPAPATILTIHDVASQGVVPRTFVDELDLGWDVFKPEAAEFFGQLSLLKLGVISADRVATVSPRYAREITTPEHGAGLEGFLRERPPVGILNGIDTEVWDPARDPHLAVRYDAEDRTGKVADKAALQRELGLPVRTGVPVYAFVARFTEQKGFGLVADAAGELARLEAQFVFMGRGERRFESALDAMSRRHPARFAWSQSDDVGLVHRVHAGADFFVMPSLHEPCGLQQMHAQR
jgi:starch synthase